MGVVFTRREPFDWEAKKEEYILGVILYDWDVEEFMLVPYDDINLSLSEIKEIVTFMDGLTAPQDEAE